MAVSLQEAYEIAAIAVGNYDDETSPRGREEGVDSERLKLGAEFYQSMMAYRRAALDELMKWAGWFEEVYGERWGTAQRSVEAAWGYIRGQGYGIWPLELEWEDVKEILSSPYVEDDRRNQAILDEVVDIISLPVNRRYLDALEKIQHRYINAITEYRQDIEDFKKKFVREWNRLTEDEKEDSGLDLPYSRPITVEDFDDYFYEYNGNISTVMGALGYWLKQNGMMIYTNAPTLIEGVATSRTRAQRRRRVRR